MSTSDDEERSHRVALVGAGSIAELHIQALASLGHEIVALVDPRTEAARRLAASFDIPHCYLSTKELLAELGSGKSGIDCLHILTPPQLHVPIAQEAILAGLSVFVEKPLGLGASDCLELGELACANGVKLGVNHSQVFHPSFIELQQKIKDGAIGPAQHVSALASIPLRQLAQKQYGHWMFQEPRNILLESGLHPFSLIYRLLGEVRDASTLCSRPELLGGKLPFIARWQSQLHCERGSASLYLQLGAKQLESRLDVLGSDGMLSLDIVRGSLEHYDKTRWPEFYEHRLLLARAAKSLKNRASSVTRDYFLSLFGFKGRSDLFFLAMRGSIKAFHDALSAGKDAPVAAPEAASVVAYCEAVWANRKPTAGISATKPESAINAPAQDAREVLVTGASGFIGRHLVLALLAKGYAVRALVRNPAFLPTWLEHEGVKILQGDLETVQDWSSAVRGCKAVFHLATGMGEDWESSKNSGIDGCRRLALASIAEGVERFIFTSSVAALYLGALGTEELVDESLPVDPRPQRRSLYARLKIGAEEVLHRLYREKGLALVTFRPALVIGEGGRTRHSGAGYWPNDCHCIGWGEGTHPLPFVLAEDVVSALIAGMEKKGIEGRVFNLAGKVSLTAQEYVQELERAGGRKIHFHPAALWKIQAIDILKYFVKLVIRRKNNRFPSYRDLKTRALKPRFDCKAARDLLDWACEDKRTVFIEKGIRIPIQEDGGPA